MHSVTSLLSCHTRVGDRVVIRCPNSNRIVAGVVHYSGPSSTPGCWAVDVIPDDILHPVSPVRKAWDMSHSPNGIDGRQG